MINKRGEPDMGRAIRAVSKCKSDGEAGFVYFIGIGGPRDLMRDRIVMGVCCCGFGGSDEVLFHRSVI